MDQVKFVKERLSSAYFTWSILEYLDPCKTNSQIYLTYFSTEQAGCNE